MFRTAPSALCFALLCALLSPLGAHADAVFTCTNASAGSFSSCAWPSQWRLTSPAAVTDSSLILYCPAGTAGNQDISACSGVRWTTKPLIPAQGLVGVCLGAVGGGNPAACDIASGGGESWQLQSTVFGTGGTIPAPTLTFTANPLTVVSGAASSLAWIGTNVTSCTASGAWSGAQAVSGTQATGALTINSTFNLDCSGPGGPISRTVTVTVTAPPPAPTLTFTANPTTVVSGNASTLAWTATNVTSCTASGAWSGAKAVSGTQTTGVLTIDSTFGLDCSGPGGPISRSVTVTVTAAPPTLTFTANPTTVVSGNASSLTWAGTNVTSCTASGAWSGAQAVSGTQSTGALTVNSTFGLDCSGPGGPISRSVTITVTAPAPTLTFTANPMTVTSGSASSLAWIGTNVTSCTASGTWSGAQPVSGTQATGVLTITSTFNLDCSGPGGPISRSVTVTVAAPPAPTLTFTPNPTTVTSGSASTLTWNSTNAASCTASGGWSGSKATSGSQSTGALTANATFTLDCAGAGGSISKSVAVVVTPVSTSALAVFVCTNTSASDFSSCAFPSQWRLANPAAVTDGNLILYCPAGTTGNQDISACSGARWTTKPLIPAQGLVGVCLGAVGGGNPRACDIGAGGGESWELKSTVFGTGGTAPTLTFTANPQIMASGASSTLTWSSTDASACTASGAWSGIMATSGTRSTGALTSTSTFSLTCTSAGGSTLRSVTVTVTPPPAPVGTNFGLEFPGDGAVRRMLFWHNPFPIYDATYIFKVYPRKKLVPSNSPTGYYTTFFWGNDGTFIWDAGNPNTYYGAHPYPIPAPDGPGQWEIAVEGGDDVTGTEVVWDRWYTQAFRAWRESPSVTHHEFYWDLPDTSKVITHTITDPAWAATNPPTPAIVIGQSPNLDGVSWGGYPGWEEFNGIIRGIQIYSGLLTVQDILTEIGTPMSTTAGQNFIWYLNLNPRPSDVTDKKGLGIPNNPSWDGTTALEWTQ